MGAQTAAEYEIDMHRDEASAVGLPEHVIDGALSGSAALGDKRFEAAVGLVDQLIPSVGSDAPAAGMLQEHFTDGEIAEIVLLTGYYAMTSMFGARVHAVNDRLASAENQTPTH